MGAVAGSLRNAQLAKYRLHDTIEVAPVNRPEQGLTRLRSATDTRPKGANRAQLGGLVGMEAAETGAAKNASRGENLAP